MSIEILKELLCIDKYSNASFKEEHFSVFMNLKKKKKYLHKNI